MTKETPSMAMAWQCIALCTAGGLLDARRHSAAFHWQWLISRLGP